MDNIVQDLRAYYKAAALQVFLNFEIFVANAKRIHTMKVRFVLCGRARVVPILHFGRGCTEIQKPRKPLTLHDFRFF
jgi:hypothetical protein